MPIAFEQYKQVTAPIQTLDSHLGGICVRQSTFDAMDRNHFGEELKLESRRLGGGMYLNVYRTTYYQKGPSFDIKSTYASYYLSNALVPPWVLFDIESLLIIVLIA